MTKRTDVLRAIAKAAKRKGVDHWITEGSNHTLLHLGVDGLVVPIPRHKEIGRWTALDIYKECEQALGKDWWRS